MSYKFLSTILGADANFTGNVGVGTTTPDSKLTILSPSTSNQILFNIKSGYTAGGNQDIFKVTQTGSDGFVDINNANGITNVHLSGYNNSGYPSYILGNVGIGTTSPSQKLTVQGVINSDDYAGSYYGAWLYGSSNNGTESYLGLGPWYSQAGYVKWIDNSRLSIYTYNASRFVSLQEAGGNVVIGSSTDAGYKLDVNGTGRFNGQLVGTNAIFNLGATTAFEINSVTNYNSSVNYLVNGTSYFTAQVLGDATNLGDYRVYSYSAGEVFKLKYSTGAATFSSLLGSGTRMVVADSSGTLSTQAVPTGTVTGSGTTNYISKWTSSSALGNSLLYDDGTNIGIGTTSPAQKLSIIGGIGVYYNDIKTFTNAYGSNGLIRLYGTDNLEKFQQGLTSGGDAYLYTFTGNNLLFYTNNGSERMRIASGGNVLIGTTTDNGAKLQVNGFSYFGSDVFTFTNGGIFFSGYGSYGRGIYSNSNGLTLQTSGSPKVTINDAGNMGIGTSNPLYTLQVGGTQTDALGIGTTSYGGSSGQALGSISVRQEGGGNGGYLDFQTLHWGSSPYGLQTRMSIDYLGNVGIGTTSPTNTLTVVSGSYTTARTENNLSSNYFTLSNYSGSYSASIFSILNDLGFATSNSATEGMRLTSAGNLLIGTTTDNGNKLQIDGINGISLNGVINQNGNQTYSLFIPAPSANFGNCVAYLRLSSSSTALITTLRVTISTTWNWAAGFGYITADYSFYNSGGTLNFANRTVLTANGMAANALNLGELVFEGGYLSIPIYSSNTNGIYVKIENVGNLNISTIAYSSWVNTPFPGSNSVYVQTQLGIGTTSPGYKLQVSGESMAVLNPNSPSSLSGADATLYLGGAAVPAYIKAIPCDWYAQNYRLEIGTQASTTAQKTYITFATEGAERMRIASTGNVLIGTTTDNGYKLQVSGPTSINIGSSVLYAAALTVSDSTNSLNYMPYVGSGGYNSLSYGGGSILFNNISSRFTVGTHDGTAIQFGPTNTLISGNVGIGTTSPQLTSSGRGNLTINGSSQSILALTVNDNWKTYLYTNGTDSYLGVMSEMYFYVSAAGTLAMKLASSGNVLIGTTTDAGYKLQVAGTGYVSSTLQVGGGAYNGYTLQVEGATSFLDTVIQNLPANGNALGGITSFQSQSNLTYNFSNGNYSGETITGFVLTDVYAGQIVALRPSAQLWQLADASVNGPLGYNMLGIVCYDATSGNSTTILLNGFFASNSYYSSSPQFGSPMYLSPTIQGNAEDTAPSTTGNIVRIVGHINEYSNANGVFVLRFNPDNFWLVI